MTTKLKNNISKIISVIAMCLLISSQAYAWGSRLHMKMVSDAFHIMPKAFKTYLIGANATQAQVTATVKSLMTAAVEPDRVLRDFHNHVFHIQGFNMGKGPFHLQELVEELTEDIKAKKSKKDIIQKLGWIAHYTCDLTQPLHTGTSLDDTIEEKKYHSSFERHVDKHAYYFGVKFDGCHAVKRISARIIYDALWANQYYDAIQEAYTTGNKFEDTKQIATNCYSKGVNNVVDMWYTAWVRSGGKVNPSDKKSKYYPPMKKIVTKAIQDLEDKRKAEKKKAKEKKKQEEKEKKEQQQR